MSISLQQLLKEKDRKIQQLERTVDEIFQEYERLTEKHLDCITDGRDKQREIDRLNNIINTGGIPPIQEIENLRTQLREWKSLALQFHSEERSGLNSISRIILRSDSCLARSPIGRISSSLMGFRDLLYGIGL